MRVRFPLPAPPQFSAISRHVHTRSAAREIDARAACCKCEGVERVAGIEPASQAWKASALPLSYTRLFKRLGPVSLPPPRGHLTWPADALAQCHHNCRVVNIGSADRAGTLPPPKGSRPCRMALERGAPLSLPKAALEPVRSLGT